MINCDPRLTPLIFHAVVGGFGHGGLGLLFVPGGHGKYLGKGELCPAGGAGEKAVSSEEGKRSPPGSQAKDVEARRERAMASANMSR